MRKKLLLLVGLFIAISSAANAQDTLLFEDFNDTIGLPPFGADAVYPYAIVGDTLWSNYDQDGIPDASTGGTRAGEWFWVSLGSSDSLTQGLAFGSSSWTNDFNNPVYNWLITPAIQITDGASALVKWKTTPSQTPAYCDGYIVLVSTTTNDLPNFTDTLFIAAEYSDEAGQYNLYCGDFAPYVFTPAGEFVHGMDGNNIELNPDFDMNAADTTCADSSRNNGLFKNFTAALSDYDNQMIYIAFLHNSTDDNLLLIDDILITENTDPFFSIETLPDFAGSVYPNPATEFVNIDFDISKYHNASCQMINSSGQVMYSSLLNTQNHRIDLQNISAGVYFVKIMADEGNMVKKLVVRK